MPVSYLIDKNQRLVFSRLSGTVTEPEVYEHNRKLRTDPDFNPGFRQLVDCTGLTEILVATGTITRSRTTNSSLPEHAERSSRPVTWPSGWRGCSRYAPRARVKLSRCSASDA